jgi:hypothetical protein
MSKTEKQLNTVHTSPLTPEEKNSLWFSLVQKQEARNKQGSLLLGGFKKHMMATLLALVVILGGGGVVAASNQAVPGDALYGIDQAVEKVQIKLANSEEKKSELQVKFAEERLSEVATFVERGSNNIRGIDLSTAVLTEVEVDVFTNETTVKIEANDKRYGFVTAQTDKDAIIEEIQEKYSLTRQQIEAVLSFETEDRASRADDKDFLNSANSVSYKSEKQKQEFEGSLTEVSDLIANSNLSDEEKARLGTALQSIMTLLALNPDLEMEFKTSDGFKLEVEDGKVEIKTNNGKGKDDKGDDDSNDDSEDESDDDSNDDSDESDDNSDDDSSDDNSDNEDDGNDSDDDSEDNSDDNDSSDNNDDDNDSNDDNDNSDNDSSDDNDDEDGNSSNDNEDEDDSDDNSGSGNNNDDDSDEEDDN